jgi:ABC-type glycerol-3-phosphate transport system permease component
MSPELLTCLIAVAANLAGMLVIYSTMSFAFARRGGLLPIVTLLMVSQLFWIVPAVWIIEARGASRAGSYALWFGNWLVSGFSIVVLRKSIAEIPAALNDMVKMDGLGGLAAWRRAVLPFVSRDLVILGGFTVMATLLPFWGVINQPEADRVLTIFQRSSTIAEHVAWMVAGSLAGALALIAIFFFAGRALSRPK